MSDAMSLSNCEWKESKLGSFLKVKHGFAFKGEFITNEVNENILVTPGNFNIGGGFKSDKFKYYKSKYPVEYILNAGDIIVTMTDLSKESDTLGYSAKIPNDNSCKFLHNQRIGLVIFNSDEVEKEYIYWLMRTREYQGYIVSSASGTSIMHTSPSRIENYEFLLPPLQEQKAIASVLSSLDDKIDLLHRQNKTLEAMAETLFRQWFIEEAEGDEKTLADYVDTANTGLDAIRRAPIVEKATEIKCLRIQDVSQNKKYANWGFTEVEERDYTKFQLKKNDIMIARTGASVGVNLFIMEDLKSVFNNGLIRIRANKNKVSPNLIYYLLRTKEFKGHIDGISGGTATQPNIQIGDLLSFEFTFPSLNTQNKIIGSFNAIDDRVHYNNSQIDKLENIRDTLLPKLMSGEVRVNL